MILRNRMRFLALLLTLLMLLSACTKEPERTLPTFPDVGDVPEDTTVPTETTVPQERIIYQTVPKTVDNPDNLPVLNIVCLPMRSMSSVWGEGTADAINTYLDKQGMAYRVQFHIFLFEDWPWRGWSAEPEVQEALVKADVIHAYFETDEDYALLQSITKYVESDAEPALVDAVPHGAYWRATTRKGEIFAVSANSVTTKGNGWYVAGKVITKYGLTVADFEGKYFWEMDEAFAKVYEQNGSKHFLGALKVGTSISNSSKYCVPSCMQAILYNRFTGITSVYAIDYSGETPVVVNYLDTEYTRNTQEAMDRYRQAGYYSGTVDSSAGGSGYALIDYQSVFADFVYTDSGGLAGSDYRIPVERLHFAYGGTFTSGYMNGVSASTQHTEEAVSFLSLLGDAEFRQLLYTAEEGESNYKFLSAFSSVETGDPATYRTEGSETRLQSHRNICDGCTFRLTGNIFDLSGLETEIEAVNEVAVPYLKSIYALDANSYERMLHEIEDAGGDKLLAELQRQLEAWLAENPDWKIQYS